VNRLELVVKLWMG